MTDQSENDCEDRNRPGTCRCCGKYPTLKPLGWCRRCLGSAAPVRRKPSRAARDWQRPLDDQ